MKFENLTLIFSIKKKLTGAPNIGSYSFSGSNLESSDSSLGTPEKRDVAQQEVR
jgi:hypothetical protein